MPTGIRKPLQVPEDAHFNQLSNQEISGKLMRDKDEKFLVLPSKNTNNLSTIDYDAHFITKTDYAINHVIKTITVPE